MRGMEKQINTTNNIIQINRARTFTLQEAQSLLPVVLRITKIYRNRVDSLLDRCERLSATQSPELNQLELEIDQTIEEWQSKVKKLGGHPKGVWIADFDSGDGYFCWKYPELKIEHWHHYHDGFSKRVRVHQKQEKPDRNEQNWSIEASS